MTAQSELSQLMSVVKSDIGYLQRQLRGPLDDDTLRRDSVVLRRLAINGDLQRLWSLCGRPKQPMVVGRTLANQLDAHHLVLAVADTVDETGEVAAVEVRNVIDQGLPLAAKRPVQKFPGPHDDVPMFLSNYLSAPCAIANGVKITRRDLIKFVANKLGGAHLDMRRDDGQQGRLLRLLDEISGAYSIGGRNPVYGQVHAAGRAIATSQDVIDLIAM